MKKVILSLVCAIIAFASSAQTEKGFRGFVDLGYTISTSHIEVYGYGGTQKIDISNRLMGSFTGGYQIIPEFFAGVGVGVTYWHQTENKSVGVPIFADLRYDLRLEGRFSFFADVRLGYSVADIEGFYCAPYVGARYALTEKMGLNLGLGYEMQKQKEISGSMGGFALKLGFDF